ncbi:hypothetical protein D0Y65_049033 [Glycine soja]|uniref:Uncharacterized protein n=1 Tax=Glycine soja TaxID=3848 RepID=A0A0B2PIW0_GLYSO|nr:hypothetical protein glysoja_034983 [Glycine soja]RZB52800.1 hypothetical protein D0Y65_049033 [Glycine soja]
MRSFVGTLPYRLTVSNFCGYPYEFFVIVSAIVDCHGYPFGPTLMSSLAVYPYEDPYARNGYGVGHRTSEVHLGAQSQIANMYFVGFLKVESYIVFWVDPSF